MSIAVLAVSLVLLVLLIGAAIGRYVHQLHSEGSVRAEEFYFTSDFLDGDTHTLAPGSTQVSFTLGNHADELRYSEMNINYKVTVTSNNGTEATVSPSAGTLEMNKKSDATITISGLQPGTYTVTAVGEGGYSKTLTGTIVIPNQKSQLYYHIDTVSEEYTLLTVWNEGDVAGEVTIAYTGIPDNTNPNMTTWQTDDSHRVTIEPHASKVFRFFSGTVNMTGAADKEPG